MIMAYKSLKSEILAKINESKPGTRLPSVRALRREYHVSQATIDRAFYELEHEKYVYKERGVGTFVADRKGEEASANYKTIALLMPQIGASSFFTEIAQGVEDALFENKCQMVLRCSNDSIRPELEHIKRLQEQKPDGVVYLSSWPEPDNFIELKQLSETMPMSLIDVAVDGLHCDYVTTDDDSGAYSAVSHLIEEKGHSNIAIMLRAHNCSTIHSRFSGYKRALDEHGIAFDENLVIHSNFDSAEAPYYSMKEALNDEDKDFSALFAASDKMAHGALKAVREHGLAVPEEFSIIGFGDLDLSDKKELSTVKQPTQNMGRKAVELLLEKVNGKRPEQSYKEVIFPTKLCIRNT